MRGAVIPITSAGRPEPLANVEAEAALLGALIIENDLIAPVAKRVAERDFLEPFHARLFEKVVAENRRGRSVTPIILAPHFADDDGLEQLGGRAYLTQLTGDLQGLLAPEDLANQIHELAQRRRNRDGHIAAAQAYADLSVPMSEIVVPDGPDEWATGGKLLPVEFAGDVQPVLDGFWLIDDFLPKSGPAALYGHPGSGKTFLALSISAHVAEGKEFGGRHVTGGPVIYLVAEGLSGFRNRLAAMFNAGLMSRDAPFAYIPVPIDLQSPSGDVESLIATVRNLEARIGAPALVVVDTLSKTFGAGKENTDDMAVYVANCERIAAAFDCLTLIVHHRPKDTESRELRGHSSLRGGVVASVLVEGDEIKTATTVKQKDGPEGERISFELERVVLGTNSRGKDVSTCLVRMVDNDVADAISHPARRLVSGHNLTALDVLTDELDRWGEPVPSSIPADAIDRSQVTRVVRSGQVRTKLADTMSGKCPDKNADTIQRSARRALQALEGKEICGSWGEWIWLR